MLELQQLAELQLHVHGVLVPPLVLVILSVLRLLQLVDLHLDVPDVLVPSLVLVGLSVLRLLQLAELLLEEHETPDAFLVLVVLPVRELETGVICETVTSDNTEEGGVDVVNNFFNMFPISTFSISLRSCF